MLIWEEGVYILWFKQVVSSFTKCFPSFVSYPKNGGKLANKDPEEMLSHTISSCAHIKIPGCYHICNDACRSIAARCAPPVN